MREIKAFVRPGKVNEIFQNLLDAGFPNLTVSLVEGTGKFEGGKPSVSSYFSITNNHVAKIEIVCNKDDMDKIVAIISKHGRTGNPGDGIIYVSDVQKSIQVKTGDIDL